MHPRSDEDEAEAAEGAERSGEETYGGSVTAQPSPPDTRSLRYSIHTLFFSPRLKSLELKVARNNNHQHALVLPGSCGGATEFPLLLGFFRRPLACLSFGVEEPG